MPYRHAHWWLLSLFPLAVLAFWPNYLSQIRTAATEFHAHGITASLWLALLALQSWSIHHDRTALHRSSGLASLALFPLFLAGGIGIFIGMARRLQAHATPFYDLYAARLAWLDIVAVAGFAFFFFQALKWRRKVHVHSRYMLATVLFLLPPIFGRLFGIPLGVRGPEDFPKLFYGFQGANLLTAAIALVLAIRSGKHGRPFYLSAALTLLAAALFQTVGGWPEWEALFLRAAELPTAPMALLAAMAGTGVGWAGWVAGRRPVAPVSPMPA
jgi:hypothetical protein